MLILLNSNKRGEKNSLLNYRSPVQAVDASDIYLMYRAEQNAVDKSDAYFSYVRSHSDSRG
jgi:hypothetical protein